MSSLQKQLLLLIGIALVLSGMVWIARPSNQAANPSPLIIPSPQAAAPLLTDAPLFDFGTISDSGKILLALVAISALIDSINPCAFSILFLTIAFLFSLGQLRSTILRIGGAYIFGIFLAYLAIGLGILHTLHFFNIPNFMGKLGAVLLITLGLINLINVFVPTFPIKLRIPHAAHKRIALLIKMGSLPAAFVLGGFVGLCEFPCTGGPYLMILGLLYDQATYLKGVGYLIFYNAVFILPLAAVLAVAGNEAVLSKLDTWRKEHSRAMRIWSSAAMIILGLLILTL